MRRGRNSGNLRNEVVKLNQEVSALEGERDRLKKENDLVKEQIEDIQGQTRRTELSLVNAEKDLEAQGRGEKGEFQIGTLSAEEREIDTDVITLTEELKNMKVISNP